MQSTIEKKQRIFFKKVKNKTKGSGNEVDKEEEEEALQESAKT